MLGDEDPSVEPDPPGGELWWGIEVETMMICGHRGVVSTKDVAVTKYKSRTL